MNAAGPNLYRSWTASEASTRWLLRREDVLSDAEVGAAEDWARTQRNWGLHVRLRDGAAGRPQVLEVLGPDLEVPQVIIYRTRHGVQADEFTGDSHLFASLDEALGQVAAAF